jgi:superfamily II DNA or RNA helicase
VNLWPHQQEAIRICAEAHHRARSRVLVQFPTGTGKTEVAILVALAYLRARAFSRVLIVTPSGPILEQFVARLAASSRQPVYREKADRHAPRGARLVVASQNSLWERLSSYGRDTLLLYDECHHANLDAEENLRIASSFNHVVGLSASPWSRGCLSLFADAARVTLGLSSAQASGFLAPLSIEDWTPPQGPYGLVFCSSNAEAAAWAAEHPRASWIGVNSGQVTQRIAAWRAGQHPVLYVNRMLGEGFDEPRINAVWLAVESESDIRYVQMAGRALRAAPGKRAHIYCRTPTIRQRLLRALERAGFVNWSGRTEPFLDRF